MLAEAIHVLQGLLAIHLCASASRANYTNSQRRQPHRGSGPSCSISVLKSLEGAEHAISLSHPLHTPAFLQWEGGASRRGLWKGKELAHSGRDTKADGSGRPLSIFPSEGIMTGSMTMVDACFICCFFHLQTDPWTGFKCLWLRGVAHRKRGCFQSPSSLPYRGVQVSCNFLLQDLSCLQTRH